MDKALQREQTRKRVERYRNKEKALHSDSVTPQSLTERRICHLAEALVDPIKRSKLTLISRALGRTMTGLDGKPLNLWTMVRYGIEGYTFNEIKELL